MRGVCCLLAAAALALIGAGRWLSRLVGKSEEAVPRVALLALLVAGIAETGAIAGRLMEARDAGGARAPGSRFVAGWDPSPGT